VLFSRAMEVTAYPCVLVRRMRTEKSPPGRRGETPAVLGASHTDTHAHKESQPPPPRHPFLKVFLERQRRDPDVQGSLEKARHRNSATVISGQ